MTTPRRPVDSDDRVVDLLVVSSISERVASVINRALMPLNVGVLRPSWLDWRRERSFELNGQSFPFFYHRHNCGFPPSRGTDRVVELALADVWLSLPGHRSVVEVGAVTPYYWPGRVPRIVDVADPSPLVTDRKSIFDVDLTGQGVLSVSTIEHIGHGDYGQPNVAGEAARAARKIFAEAASWLVTFPTGYNHELDRWVRSADVPRDVDVRFLVRPDDWGWREENDPNRSLVPYGPMWANGLTVMWRSPT